MELKIEGKGDDRNVVALPSNPGGIFVFNHHEYGRMVAKEVSLMGLTDADRDRVEQGDEHVLDELGELIEGPDADGKYDFLGFTAIVGSDADEVIRYGVFELHEYVPHVPDSRPDGTKNLE